MKRFWHWLLNELDLLAMDTWHPVGDYWVDCNGYVWPVAVGDPFWVMAKREEWKTWQRQNNGYTRA